MVNQPFFRALALAAAVTAGSLVSAHASNSVPVPSGSPQMLSIPKIGVHAAIESVAFNSPRDTEAPFKWGDVAWYSRGPRPGDVGRATIYGHLDSLCCPAVFWYLRNLKKGDSVNVTYGGRRNLTFRVQWKAVYPNSHLPLSFMYGRTTARGVLLITCAGMFHRDGSGYDHKLIVYATMPPPSPPKTPGKK